jgi:hypothetical protein
VVVRDILHVEGAHNSLSQSMIMDLELRITPANGFRITVNVRRGQQSLVAVAPQVGGVFKLDMDMKVARNVHLSRNESRK